MNQYLTASKYDTKSEAFFFLLACYIEFELLGIQKVVSNTWYWWLKANKYNA